jgi:4-diphosphocytidyl-2-C-methyl-D-erythritol kinase
MATTVRSFSKINLGLAIGPTRLDGFHALTTLYQTLAAHDLVTVEARPAEETAITITSNDARVPTDERNTAFKSVNLALNALKHNADVRIHLDKRLPVQGGLGAGSANAVAALVALERELGAHGIAPLPGAEKLSIAAEVGSDVPLFLIGGAVLGVGRGEEVYPLPDLPPTHCVLALPDVGVSTPQAFRDWDARHTERADPAPGLSLNPALTQQQPFDRLRGLSRVLASALCEPHSSGVFLEDLAENSGPPANMFAGVNSSLLALVRTGIENDFEEVVFPQNPSLGEIKRELAALGHPEHAALCAALSGSGSALFGLYQTTEAAAAAVVRLNVLGVRSLQTETLQRGPYWRTMLVEAKDSTAPK